MNQFFKSFATFSGAATLAALGFSAPLALSPARSEAQSAAAPQLQQAVAALRGITTLKASFTQTDRNGQRVGGELTMKQPGRIRFQYEKGVPMLIVSDGKALTMIDYEVRQVQRWPISNSPLGALLDPKRDVARYGRLMSTDSPDVISIEVRDTKHPEYGVINLVFVRKASAPGGLELVNWVSLDSQNKRTTIRLSGHQYGVAVGDDAFRWKDPRTPPRR